MSQAANSVDLPPAPPPPDEPPWHRLNPLVLIIHPLRELIRYIPVLVGLFFFGRSGDTQQWISLTVVVALVLRGVLHWATARYRITGEQVELRSGVVFRKARTVPRDRLRTVDITAEWHHRLVGLCALKIGTGQRDKGLILDGVTRSTAERLRTELLRRPSAERPRTPASAVTSPAEEVLASMDRRWVRFAPFTFSGVAVVGALAGAAYQIARELHVDPVSLGPLRQLATWASDTSAVLVVPAGVLALLVIVTAASVLGYVLSYWNFLVTREGSGTLHIRHGLLTTRSVSIEESRLRGVQIKEALPLRLVGGGRCAAVVTGLRTGRGDERGGGLLLPAAPLGKAHEVAARVLRETNDPTTAGLRRHPKAAARRRVIRALGWALLLVVASWLGGLVDAVPSWLPGATLVLLPLSVLVGLDRYRSLGHTLAGGYLVSRHGSLTRHTVALRGDGIIGWRLHASFFQRRAGLMTVVATTAAGRGGCHVTDMAAAEAVPLVGAAMPGLVEQFVEPTAQR